jgi:hypothetical protein
MRAAEVLLQALPQDNGCPAAQLLLRVADSEWPIGFGGVAYWLMLQLAVWLKSALREGAIGREDFGWGDYEQGQAHASRYIVVTLGHSHIQSCCVVPCLHGAGSFFLGDGLGVWLHQYCICRHAGRMLILRKRKRHWYAHFAHLASYGCQGVGGLS